MASFAGVKLYNLLDAAEAKICSRCEKGYHKQDKSLVMARFTGWSTTGASLVQMASFTTLCYPWNYRTYDSLCILPSMFCASKSITP
jgi:hypothetical protein